MYMSAIVAICCVALTASGKEYGRVMVVLSTGDTVAGYTAPLMDKERTSLKVSPEADGKRSVKYDVKGVRYVEYVAPGETAVQHWEPVNLLNQRVVLMMKALCGRHTVLWRGCVSRHDVGAGGAMRYVERVADYLGFTDGRGGGVAWDLNRVSLGRCKEAPGFNEFVKEYKKACKDNGTWTGETSQLIEMCDSYADANP